MYPDRMQLTDEQIDNVIQYRFYTKTLSSDWITEMDDQELSEEEQFVKLLISTQKNLSSIEELQLLLDEFTYSKRMESYGKRRAATEA